MKYTVIRQDVDPYILSTDSLAPSLALISMTIKDLYHNSKPLTIEAIAKDLAETLKCDPVSLEAAIIEANNDSQLGVYTAGDDDYRYHYDKVFRQLDISNTKTLIRLLELAEGPRVFKNSDAESKGGPKTVYQQSMSTPNLPEEYIYQILPDQKKVLWCSLAAASYYLSIGQELITSCINNPGQLAGGCTWSKADELATGIFLPQLSNYLRKGKPGLSAYQIYPNGLRVLWPSVGMAARLLDLPDRDLARCVRNPGLPLGGYTWDKAPEARYYKPKTVRVTPEGFERPIHANSKPVYRIDDQGNKVLFYSRVEAAASIGLRRNDISNCLNSKSGQAGGYTWEIAEMQDL